MAAAPAAAEVVASCSTAGLLLTRCTVTPPWFDAASTADKAPTDGLLFVCNPAPTSSGKFTLFRPCTVTPGVETATATVAEVVLMNPGIVATTVVVPPPIEWNAMPPAATEVGELLLPSAIVTVCVCADPLCFTN